MTPGPVLVTGAGGFIGGRIVEILHAAGLGPVRAGVRRWASAAQVGRLPVELTHCDVENAASLAAAMRGARAVVHCAIGGGDVNVVGTRLVLEAALAAGVERVVHFSTIDVYGKADGTYPETAPRIREGAAYGDSKIAAEEVVEEFRARGLPITMLRPTIVYGPGSTLWTVEFADRLRAGTWLLSDEDTQGRCNLVYVDDLAGAVVAALVRPTPDSDTYNANGPEAVTWAQYFHALNDALGLPPLRPASRGRSRAAASLMQPVRTTAKWALRQMPGLIKAAYTHSALARRVMRAAEGRIRQTPTAGEFRMYSLQTAYPIEKAARQLGWQPRIGVAEGVALSAAWYRDQFMPWDA